MYKLLCIGFMLISTIAGAQKLMKVPDILEKNSEVLPVKLKGGFGFPKYEFEPYKIISGKSGWGTSTTTGNKQPFITRLFTKAEQETSKQKSNFTFADKSGDTAIVNVAVKTILNYSDDSKALIRSSGAAKEFEGGTSEYIASVKLNCDTNEWILRSYTSESPSRTLKADLDFSGSLTQGNRKIVFREVDTFEDGTKGVFGMPLGVVFIENGSPVAAVQYRGLVLKQQKQRFVWLLKQSDNCTRFLFATAAAALMARADQIGITLDDPANH